jgi:hypothetical protein
MEKLDLRDATLAGFSMGTGEVTRYLGQYGSASRLRVSHRPATRRPMRKTQTS